ncbi:hypothetical protein [Chitinimonas sp. BJYL2]|uniref:hypothetical protein n=1 Tax=Chitinimonas sp. BJYL2 TaxID=2976696 RepID=UPI0022B3E2AE|nr:hypothetical protein [Chitinimonas sp. BJYL2]
MKQKLISRLVVGALASVAATAAFAGQIQSSSVSIAREVIVDNDQEITSPRVSYRFAGDVDARSQNQVFQVQFILENGARWETAGNAANIQITDGVGGQLATQGASGAGDYEVTALDIGGDNDEILYATITVWNAAFGATTLPTGNLIKQPLISMSAGGTRPTVADLYDVVGEVVACDTAVKQLPVSFKHFVALSAPASLASAATATEDEHTRGNSTNRTTLITFPTNVLVKVTKSTGDAKLDVAGGNDTFAGATGTSYISATLANLGNVSLVQNASGYDSNLADPYILADAGGDADGVAGLYGVATADFGAVDATPDGGTLEIEKVTVKISANQGFVTGGTVFLSTAANCGAAIAGATTGALSASAAAAPITLTISTANVNGAFGATGVGPVHVCYQVPGTAVIPASSFYVDEARLVKAADGGAFENEQDNFCSGPLYALSGSVKIDVRNYASANRTDGWMSIIRLINPSETRTATVYGQYISADGKYGKWGKLVDLKPRAVVNYTAAQVDAKLTSAPAHPTAANNMGSADTLENASYNAPRLRITSETGDTLRVQNYLFNPASQNFIEASSSQGVDFAGTADRAPASEGQYQDQDAHKGINGGN